MTRRRPLWRQADTTVTTRQTRLMAIVLQNLSGLAGADLRELASLAGCTVETLNNWLRGDVEFGSGRVLSGVMDAMGLLEALDGWRPGDRAPMLARHWSQQDYGSLAGDAASAPQAAARAN